MLSRYMQANPTTTSKTTLHLHVCLSYSGMSNAMLDMARHYFVQRYLKPNLDELKRTQGGSAISWARHDILSEIQKLHRKESSLQKEKAMVLRIIESRKVYDTDEEKEAASKRRARKKIRLGEIGDELSKCLSEKIDAITHNLITRGKFKVPL